MKRYSIDGSDALEEHLERICQRVLGGVQALIPAGRLQGLVLGGGYGRGEGGVLKTEIGDEPYNDLEFYAFLRGNRLLNEWKYSAALEQFATVLSLEARLHVEFKIESIDRLRCSPISMYSYDLVSGHRVLAGGDDLFHGCEHHFAEQDIPLSEATRLLFNRCTGLLLAKEFLQHNPLSNEQQDFIGRNIAKAQLALGDAVLTAFGQYHWSCRERHSRLQRLIEERWSGNVEACACPVPPHPGPLPQGEGESSPVLTTTRRLDYFQELDTIHPLPEGEGRGEGEQDIRFSTTLKDMPSPNEVVQFHGRGVEFKLHPQRTRAPAHELEQAHQEISKLALGVWLWLESRRLNRQFCSANEYALSETEKCPETARWRNCLLNLRTFGCRSLLAWQTFRYPRERLFNALALLLWNENDLRQKTITRRLQTLLETNASDWAAWVAAYKRIWPAYG